MNCFRDHAIAREGQRASGPGKGLPFGTRLRPCLRLRLRRRVQVRVRVVLRRQCGQRTPLPCAHIPRVFFVLPCRLDAGTCISYCWCWCCRRLSSSRSRVGAPAWAWTVFSAWLAQVLMLILSMLLLVLVLVLVLVAAVVVLLALALVPRRFRPEQTHESSLDALQIIR
jgi:hypothetical protein